MTGLVIADLTKRYSGLVALSAVSLHANSGEVLGIIGPNGAGKTTLIDIIAGSTSLTAGTITLDGVVLSRLSAHQVARKGVFRTFQRAQAFTGMSAGESLRLASGLAPRGGPVSDQSALQAALDWAEIGRHWNTMSEDLTLRELRMLEMACAKVAHPKLLLLDEPVAGLDINTRGRIGEMMHEFRDQGMAIVIVEHTLEMVLEMTDRLVVLNFGTKLAEGLPREVIANPEVQRAYVGGTPA
jgi:ABC-type branched-subunit amino acid transport system ATPase component